MQVLARVEDCFLLFSGDRFVLGVRKQNAKYEVNLLSYYA